MKILGKSSQKAPQKYKIRWQMKMPADLFVGILLICEVV